jgi:murein DD-endopeptidase MepM/ murein hydrolase activator NlpD
MKGHLGLVSALNASKIDPAQISELVTAMAGTLNMRALRADQTFEARLDPRDGRIRRFLYRTSPVSAVEVSRGAGGALKASKVEAALATKMVRVGGRIDSSLNAAISRAGESTALVAMFVDLFSWDINWYADPRDGDEFRIVVEKQFLGDKFYRYGRILAAEYRGKVGRFQAYYFKPQSAPAGYFVPEGRSLRREFLKTPLNFRRLSSKYNLRRLHPVLHTTRGHFGVDYAAPTGTPVWAAADGKVVSVARGGGGGNMVVLSHAGNVSTIYMHLSRFARGLRPGDKVRQRQVIGYVGCTGLCTGPHLHYGIRVRGRYVDPMAFNPRKGDLLPRADRIRFLDQLPARMAELEGITIATVTATASGETAPDED